MVPLPISTPFVFNYWSNWLSYIPVYIICIINVLNFYSNCKYFSSLWIVRVGECISSDLVSCQKAKKIRVSGKCRRSRLWSFSFSSSPLRTPNNSGLRSSTSWFSELQNFVGQNQSLLGCERTHFDAFCRQSILWQTPFVFKSVKIRNIILEYFKYKHYFYSQ